MELVTEEKFFEVETKYSADCVDRTIFKDFIETLNPNSFVYVESTDVYYAKSENEFIRYRMPSKNKQSGEEDRSELTFKKKTVDKNNWARIEVNLRIDKNSAFLVDAFCEGLGYTKNFSIEKRCDIFFWDDADIVYYTVKDSNGKYQSFIEIECLEDCGKTKEQSWEVVQKYEKLLLPLGITPQNRKKLSLWEMYRQPIK